MTRSHGVKSRSQVVPQAAGVALRGSSWNHTRGHAPLVATAADFTSRRSDGVRISWTPRSLYDFGTQSVDDLAHGYDLVVIDHPHIGLAAEMGSLLPLDEFIESDDLEALARRSPGRSHEAYQWGGHQWALAIDAACQVSAIRTDLLPIAPRTWEEVVELSRSGRVLWPLCGVDASASLLTLAAEAGHPCEPGTGRFLDRPVAEWAVDLMRRVGSNSDPRCWTMNPVDVLETLAETDNFAYAPLLFGYVNYERYDHPGHAITFGDIPGMGLGALPSGALLGGAGLAVSAYTEARREAVEYAHYVASGPTQRTVYFQAGGQPAHAEAWLDPEVDRAAGRFFSETAGTMERSWMRPRWPGFVKFQNALMTLFSDSARLRGDPLALLDEVDALYAEVEGCA